MALSSILGVLTDVGSYWQTVRPSPLPFLVHPAQLCMRMLESFALVAQEARPQYTPLLPRHRLLLRRMGRDRLRPRRAPAPRPLAPKRLLQVLRLPAHERATHRHHQCPGRGRHTRPRESIEVGLGQELGQHYDAEAVQQGIRGDEAVD